MRSHPSSTIALAVRRVAIAWAVCAPLSAAAQTAPADSADVGAARRVFVANLDAIRHRDRDAYLETYLHAETLARTGPGGIRLGYESHASQAGGDAWPDVFDARAMRLVPVLPGVVYGAYRYRVVYGNDEHTGLSERVFIRTPSGFRIAMTSAFDAPPGTPPPPLALVGGRVWRGSDVSTATILVRDGRIECVGQCPVPEDADVVDASATWIIPGLVDARVHLSQSGASSSAMPSAMRTHPERFFRAHLSSGVTTVFDAGGFAWTWDLRDSLATDRPHVLAAGPRLAAAPSDLDLPGEKLHLPISSARAAEEAVDYLASHGADAVVLVLARVTGRRERLTSQALSGAIAAARARGMRIVAQVNSLADAKVALRAGVDVLGSEIDAPIDEEFLTLTRSTGTVYTATCTPAKQSQQAAGIRAANLQRVHAAGIPIAVGSAAGEPGVAHGVSIHAELEAMQMAGLATPEVLNAATAGGALALGQSAECGSIDRGKRADLLLLSADPSVDIRNLRALSAVVRRGELRAAAELSDARPR